jgi:hypothetical protein
MPASSTAPAPSAESSPVQPKHWYDTVTLKGYAQFDANFPEGRSRFGSVSNFRIRRCRPSVTVQIDRNTAVKVQIDMSTGKAGSGPQSAVIGDAYGERRIRGFGYIHLGQTYLPFSHELREDHSALRSPLEMSYPADLISLGEVDQGIVVGAENWDTRPIQWEFGVFNGQGLGTADANTNATLAGRVAWRMSPFLRVGASGIAGTFKDSSVTGTGKTYRRDALGGEIQIKSSKALALSAEIYNILAANSPSAPTRQARCTGGYVLLESWIGPLKSIPFVRWQRTYGDLEYRSWDIGWRYQVSQTQRLTAQADFVRAARSNDYGVRWQVNF